MLEGEKAKERYAGGTLVGRINPEYAALFLRTVIEFDVYHWFSISDGPVKNAQRLNPVRRGKPHPGPHL